MTNEQPKVHLIDGKRYGEVERRAKVGDKIVAVTDGPIVKKGEYFETIDLGKSFDRVYNNGMYRVLEPIDSEDDLVTASADNPDQIIELLGNLARRVTELEQRVSQYNALFHDLANRSGDKFTAKQVAEIIKALGGGAND